MPFFLARCRGDLMSASLLSALNALPELTGRVFRTAVASAPAAPYARVWEAPRGVEVRLFHRQQVSRLNLRVTLYDRPTGSDTNEARAAAQVRLERLADKVRDALATVDTHLDGVKRYAEPPLYITDTGPVDDKNVAGQSYLTLFIEAHLVRP